MDTDTVRRRLDFLVDSESLIDLDLDRPGLIMTIVALRLGIEEADRRGYPLIGAILASCVEVLRVFQWREEEFRVSLPTQVWLMAYKQLCGAVEDARQTGKGGEIACDIADRMVELIGGAIDPDCLLRRYFASPEN